RPAIGRSAHSRSSPCATPGLPCPCRSPRRTGQQAPGVRDVPRCPCASRPRSYREPAPITSRSNWAKESSTLSVSRPVLDAVPVNAGLVASLARPGGNGIHHLGTGVGGEAFVASEGRGSTALPRRRPLELGQSRSL